LPLSVNNDVCVCVCVVCMGTYEHTYMGNTYS